MRNADSWVWKSGLIAVTVLLQLGPTVARAQSLSVLYHFGTNPGDPIWFREIGLLAEGSDGSLYSTSPQGGTVNNQGTVFRMTLDGKLKVLHNFDVTSGSGPQGGLTRGSDGNFYGTTYGGGKYRTGTIFKIVPPEGPLSVMYHFRAGHMLDVTRPSCQNPPCPYTTQQRLDAAAGYPVSAPVQARDGNFYGVTAYTGNYKYGVLYKISPGGGPDSFQALCIGGAIPKDPLTTDAQLINSCMFNGDKGNYPVSLIAASDGNLYGVAYGGLANNPYGTVFKATLDGRVSLVYKFDLTNGSGPYSIMQGRDGYLYGTTAGGGKGYGVAYKLSTQGGSPIFVRSLNGTTEGMSPVSGLVQGPDGNFYGTTKYGGSKGRGVLYRISPTGSDFKVLDNFDTYVTGRTPIATPMLHTNNNLYGVTYQGGSRDAGVLYRFTGLCPAQSACTEAPEVTAAGPCVCLTENRKGPCSATEQPTFTGGEVRAEEWNASGAKWLEVRTGVAACQSGNCPDSNKDGITIGVGCTDPHIVQFVSRERIRNMKDNTLYWVPGTIGTNFQKYRLSTSGNRCWATDSQGHPNPYFETSCSARTQKDLLTIFDAPGFANPPFDPQNQAGEEPETWRFTAKSFVVCGGEVVREINWSRQEAPGLDPKYGEVTVNRVTALPEEFTKLLCDLGFNRVP